MDGIRFPVLPLVGAAVLWAATAAAQTLPPAPRASDEAARQTFSLAEAVRLALEHSPQLRPARHEAVLSDLQRQVAQSAFGLKVTPSFGSAEGAYGFDQQSAGISVSKRLVYGTQLALIADSSRWDNGPGQFRDGGYSLTLVQPLLRGAGPAATADLVNARRGVERADRQLNEARQQTIVSVAESYFAVALQRRLLGVSHLALERASRLQGASAARARIGLATQLDVLRAELLASQAEAELEMRREALETALDRLKLQIGHAPESRIDVDELALAADPFAAGPLAASAVEDLVSLALQTRPEIAESRERIGDARRGQAVARWNLLPDVTLTMAYARRGFGSPARAVLNDLFGGWRVGIASSYPLDRSVQTASAATAEIALLEAEQAMVETERRVAADVRRTHRAWLRTAGTISIQQRALDLARRQLRLAEVRYERGIADNFDVIDAEHRALQAEAALVAAEVDRQLAGLALLRLVGVLGPERLGMGSH